MMQKKQCAAPQTSVGGQALIEGVMMNGPLGCALSVRTSDGDIITEPVAAKHIRDKIRPLGWPLVRGVVNYVETMILGYKTLMRSAELSGQLEEDTDPEKMSRLDRWLNDRMGPKMMGAVTVVATVLAAVLGVFLFIWLPAFLVDLIDEKLCGSVLQPYHAVFEGLLRAVILVIYMYAVSRMKDIRRVFMYHGAEHKSIFCYEKGLPLSVENVRGCRRFHPRCGTSFIFIILIVSILVSSVISIVFPVLTENRMRVVWVLVKLLVVLPIVTGVSYEMIKYAGRHDNLLTRVFSAPGLWMQRITTSEPTDDMIEVAIASIRAVTETPGAAQPSEASEPSEAPEPPETPAP